MKSKVFRILLLAVAAVFCFLVASGDAAAQCAMCRASVAGTQAFAKNMNVAVIVLLAPPVSIFSAIIFIAYRNRKG
jgi:hypothetical protein